MEEQAVTTQALGLKLKRAVSDTEFSADLTEAGASDEAMEEHFQQIGITEPVGGRKGL